MRPLPLLTLWLRGFSQVFLQPAPLFGLLCLALIGACAPALLPGSLLGAIAGPACASLLRYRADDMVVLADPDYQCPCGRSFRVVDRVLGRVDDAIRTPDGTHVVMLDWIFAGLPGLIEAQVVQERLDFVRIRIVAGPDFTARTGQVLLTRAGERLGKAVRIELERVPSIERTRNGKFRQIVSHLKMETQHMESPWQV